MSGNAQKAVMGFLADLAELRRRSGQPSLRRLEAVSRKSKRPRLPHSTIGDALTGSRLPPVQVVLGIVHSCLDYAHEEGIDVDIARFGAIAWQNRWLEVRRLCDEQDGQPAQQPLLERSASPTPTGMMWLPDRRHSRYLMIGNPSVNGASALPGVIDNIARMTRTLAMAAPWMEVITVLDPTTREIASAMQSATGKAQDVLIVHILGHGYLDERMGLRLLTRESRFDSVSATSFDLAHLIDNFQGSPDAGALVLIVDTCFAGSVIPMISSRSKRHVFFIAATDEQSLAVDGPDSLTGVMASILDGGVTDCPFPMLSVEHLARECARSLEQRQRVNRRLPHQAVTTYRQGDAHKITFGLNKAII